MTDTRTECLEHGGQIDSIYTDFKKAFDKAPHRRLISKLRSYGINDTIINWIQDFLKARKYRVKVNLGHSGWHYVVVKFLRAGLGPLLFLIYINHLADCCSNYCDIYIFAADANFSRHIVQPNDINLLQHAVDALQKWSQNDY